MSESITSGPPAGRYGRGPTVRGRRATRLGMVIGGALVVALLVWLGAGLLRDPVQWNDVGYSVKGPERVDVTFDVVKNAGATAQCTIHALNASFAEVGVVAVRIGPATEHVVRKTVTIATQELAVTGVVDSCRLVAKAAP
ncbi:DUF4307 domain-containing protein [Pengzhenrongella sp.]|uniref:DUF4307 domain-containing protein n=1 Tax=Pengzhenrongella sp. TaxID=2888820 RepID=UPI002F953088